MKVVQNGKHKIKSKCKIKSFFKNRGGIKIIDNTTKIQDADNIMYKMASKISKEIISINVDIAIKKNIPMQAGLGGGSSDAAAVLIGLDKLYNLNLSYDDKINISKSIGADVPYCTFGGDKYVTGIGEKLQDIKSEKFYFIIIKPQENMPTNLAFELFDNSQKTNRDVDFMDELLLKNKELDISIIKKYFYNDFESVISKKFKVINEIKQDFYKNGADFSMMSGSGTTVYAIYKDEIKRQNAYKRLKEIYNNIYLAKSVDKGVEIL
ncbi:MAG: 4-(cytidine 5'-diphospho)-2-C-methyl-D-erythritol kinase [Peptostreptococcaceae bacterium]|nr:4-(cytidine 5'-diphospho)-2-C-methyl-D-erythritol kinase [Peptostreptococcaceae bacterium]